MHQWEHRTIERTLTFEREEDAQYTPDSDEDSYHLPYELHPSRHGHPPF